MFSKRSYWHWSTLRWCTSCFLAFSHLIKCLISPVGKLSFYRRCDTSKKFQSSPIDCECYYRISRNWSTRKQIRAVKYDISDFGPSGRTRTCGIVLPKHARYQLRHTRKYFFLLVFRLEQVRLYSKIRYSSRRGCVKTKFTWVIYYTQCLNPHSALRATLYYRVVAFMTCSEVMCYNI